MNDNLFFFAAALVTGIYTLLPLLRQRRAWLPRQEADLRRQSLEAEKRTFLQAIRDIDFEHAAGKIDDRDHAELRNHYTAEAARVLGEIEGLADVAGGGQAAPVPPGAGPGPGALQQRQEGGESVPAAARVAALQEKLEELEIEWEMGEIGTDAYVARRDACQAKLDELAHEPRKKRDRHGCR